MIDFRLSFNDFRESHLEKAPYLFRGVLHERPFAWSDVDKLLHVAPPAAPVMRMFHHGIVPEHQFTEDTVVLGQKRRRLVKPKFYEYMRRGATLVINRLEDLSTAAHRLCFEVGRFANAQASGNAYLSFKGDGTFGKHWDTHDVFAIQLLGRKRWHIFPPTFPLPLTYQTNERSGHTCPSAATLELTLEEGDILYLPRGWWHHVVPYDQGSFHLSVGIYPPTLHDYILWTASRYLQQDERVRGRFAPEQAGKAVGDPLEDLAARLRDHANIVEFDRQMAAREQPNAEFNVAAVLEEDAASLRTGRIGLAVCQAPLIEDGSLLVNGMRVQIDQESLAVVTALRDSSPLSFEELCTRVPQMPAQIVKQAVLRLVQNDLVTIYSDAREDQ